MASAATLTLTAPILTDTTWDALGHSILVLAVGWLVLAATRLSSLLVSATVTETGQLATPGAAMAVLLKMCLEEMDFTSSFPVLATLGAMLVGQQKASRRQKSMERSLSCPALVENLPSPQAVEACADMLADFEAHKTGRRLLYGSSRIHRIQSMPTLEEAETEHEGRRATPERWVIDESRLMVVKEHYFR